MVSEYFKLRVEMTQVSPNRYTNTKIFTLGLGLSIWSIMIHLDSSGNTPISLCLSFTIFKWTKKEAYKWQNTSLFSFLNLTVHTQEVIRIVRPFQCCAGCCWCSNPDSGCSMQLHVESPPGQIIGYVKQT